MLLRLLPYHLRLSVRSLRRDPGLSAAVVLVMAVVAGLFCTCLMHYLRAYGRNPALSSDLHQVEVIRPWGAVGNALAGTTAEMNAIASRTRVSYPLYRVLAGSGIPGRETATFRARLLVGPERGTFAAKDGTRRAARPVNARYVNADFFSLFAVPLRHGAPWDRQAERSGQPVVVLSQALNEDLFGGGDSVGRTVLVNGRPHRIAGVCARHQPFVPEWDRALTGASQELVYLPFPEHEVMAAWPELPIHAGPVGARYADLLASDDPFLAYWVELTTPAQRDDYARYLSATLGARGVRYVLRDLRTVRREVRQPDGAVSFFLFVTSLIVVAGGLIMARLLLAKGLVRRDELGIFRALGAPRASLFARQLLEAFLLSASAGVASLLVAWVAAAYYNHAVADTDIPLALSPWSIAITIAVTIAVGVVCAMLPAWRAASQVPTLPGRATR